MSKIVQSLQQKLTLSPRQIMEADILQLGIVSLEKKINDEIESNPILEVDEENDDDADNEEESILDWEELTSNPDEYEYAGGPDYKSQMLENISLDTNQKNLTNDIIIQLRDMNTTEDEIKIAYEILGNLNEHGFLSVDCVLISDRMEIEEQRVLDVSRKIQDLDPPGIASRDIKECILAQLRNFYPDESQAIRIISNYYDDFANRRYDYILKKKSVTENDLVRTVELLSTLNPYPAVNYFSGSAEHITPDIIIERQDSQWQVTVNSHFTPNLRINTNYLEILNKHKSDKDVKNFIKKKIESANWFIAAIEQRTMTYEKVMKSIISHQKQYFDSNNKILNPLILKDIAHDIDMDISTVSRTTNGKYVQTPWGIKELKMFFSEGIKTKDGDIVSSHEVRKAIRETVENEDKKKPLSDECLTKEVNDRGYIVARRTVSKYRESLNIPVSRLRKKI